MTKTLIPQAYNLLTNKTLNYDCELTYSGRFKSFNANVTKRWNKLTFNMSKNWKEVNDEIKIGLIQELLTKILKLNKTKTMNTDLYNNFLKNAHIAIPKTKTHPTLEQAFNNLNKTFFNNTLEKPNFKLSNSLNTLGSYEYGCDTIKITQYLLEESELLNYVMYHEMLHKHHKFSSTTCKTIHHSKQFRIDERKFPNQKEIEQKLQNFVRKKRFLTKF
ncbi:hypothetical protein COV11_01930 [Candidatus Woesearchaeota archaeon CG10_big_fil_rev_8_21_14_0_10_30_7]|nr:MAG: hypothetical protein COV11_01930 [Candidatus Woesearchaeota archaeon CG10_big_fil_rev_8_21_14_0_10_30_7]